MGRYITDVNILAPYGDQLVHVPSGWNKLDTDLNSGVGGAYVYLVYERADQDQERPITDIRILKGDEKTPEGYQKILVDLNKGASDAKTGKPHPLFMAVTREKGKGRKAIEDLVITSWSKDDSNPAKPIDPPPGYSRIKPDLNDGVSKDTKDPDHGIRTTWLYLDRKPAVQS
ncbi:hypothetical protein ACGF13_04720 [Kitasatospora sp. NPDC048286]|uniref:hypothetical protein n=1 Tax=unclassified Kitasatospora TaxID=2633591 RepID=UPI00371EC926